MSCNLAARSCLTAAAALAAGSVIAVTPALTPSLPDVQMRAVELTASPGETLQDAMLSINSQVISGDLGLNNALLDQLELPAEQALFGGSDSALNGLVNRSYNVFNMFVDNGERSMLGLLGAHPSGPLDITRSLLLGVNPAGQLLPNIFNSGQIGGLEGEFDQGLIAFGDVTGFPPLSALEQLQTAQLGLNASILANELGFNQGLVHNEVELEQAIFGTDSALNGVVNRSYNMFNMFVDGGERTFNGILGVHSDSATQITDSLLTALFNDGTIGGFEGIVGQGYMVFADFLGLLSGDPTGLFGAFDPADLLGSGDLLGALSPLDFLTFLGI